MKGFTAEKKWERLQSSRKGFRMSISKLDRGLKESFHCLLSGRSDYSIVLDRTVMCSLLNYFFSFTHCTEVRFDSFLSGGFTTMAVINPPERKQAKRTSVHCPIFQKPMVREFFKNSGRNSARKSRYLAY